jgi:hypothetical protein
MVLGTKRFAVVPLFALAATLVLSQQVSAQCAGNRSGNRMLSTGVPQQLGRTANLLPQLPSLTALQQPSALLTTLQQQQRNSLITSLQQQQTALQTALQKTTAALTTLQDQQATTATSQLDKKLAALQRKQTALQKALQETTALLALLQSGTTTNPDLLSGSR